MKRPLVLLAVALLVVGCGTADNGSSSARNPSDNPSSAIPAFPDPTPAGPTEPVPNPPPAGFADAVETTVWIPAGDHRVPGTLAKPALGPGQTAPAVLLLHGDFSSRDENGDMFGRLAAALSDRGIASLRIDFAGSGDSEEPDLAWTIREWCWTPRSR